jgi:addiction module HigA family antidote
MNTLPDMDHEEMIHHPGEVLKADFLEPMGITQYRLAKVIGVTAMRIHDICAGKRAVTADTALRLARALGTSPRFWLGLQADFDAEEVMRKRGEVIRHIEPLVV